VDLVVVELLIQTHTQVLTAVEQLTLEDRVQLVTDLTQHSMEAAAVAVITKAVAVMVLEA
jgi:hypothetical protein